MLFDTFYAVCNRRFCRLFVAGRSELDLPRETESVAGEVVSWGLELCDEKRSRTKHEPTTLRAHVTDGRVEVPVVIAEDEAPSDVGAALASCTERSSWASPQIEPTSPHSTVCVEHPTTRAGERQRWTRRARKPHS